MIDEHAATEPMWEDDNDLRCHPQEEEAEEKNLDKYLYTRVCVCLSEFFFLFIETKKMENCVFGLIKRSFFISSFLDYWPTTRCTEAYTHTHTPCSILHSIDLKWHMFWTKYIANTNVNFIKLNWKFFFSCLSSCLIFSLTGLGGGGGGGDDELTHTPEIEIERFRSVTLEIK